MNQKRYYDKFHISIFFISIFFKIDDYAFLKFHKKYKISSTTKIIHKLNQQYVGFFPIFQKMKRFAYRLKIFFTWFIHSVSIIVQLKFNPFSNQNSYRKSKFDHPDSVHVRKNTEKYKSWKLNKSLNKRTIFIKKRKLWI